MSEQPHAAYVPSKLIWSANVISLSERGIERGLMLESLPYTVLRDAILMDSTISEGIESITG